MAKQIHKQIAFLMTCLILGSAVAYTFLHYQPLIEDYFETRHFKYETKELALLIKKYTNNHTNYSNLTVDAFDLKELPNGIYKNVNDVDLESIKGGTIRISASSSSRYNENQNAFVIGWMDVDRYGCRALVRQEWKNLPGIRFLGLAVAESDEELLEDEIYPNCPGIMNTGNAVACPHGTKLSTPLKGEDIGEVCACPSGHCHVLLKFM